MLQGLTPLRNSIALEVNIILEKTKPQRMSATNLYFSSTFEASLKRKYFLLQALTAERIA